MRMHFISRLALLIGAGFLVVATQVWTGNTLQWIFVAGGAGMIACAAVDGGMAGGRTQRMLDGAIAILGVWSIVQAFVFNGSDLKWISFATASALAVLATIGLILHESSAERIVHELTVAPQKPTTTTPLPH
jgi:hypothetical protein